MITIFSFLGILGSATLLTLVIYFSLLKIKLI